MAHERSEAGEKLANQALSKAVIYFSDKNSRTFYSRDTNRTWQQPNLDLGISRLKKMVNGWAKNIDTAIIYDNLTGDEITRFREGVWQ